MIVALVWREEGGCCFIYYWFWSIWCSLCTNEWTKYIFIIILYCIVSGLFFFGFGVVGVIVWFGDGYTYEKHIFIDWFDWIVCSFGVFLLYVWFVCLFALIDLFVFVFSLHLHLHIDHYRSFWQTHEEQTWWERKDRKKTTIIQNIYRYVNKLRQ